MDLCIEVQSELSLMLHPCCIWILMLDPSAPTNLLFVSGKRPSNNASLYDNFSSELKSPRSEPLTALGSKNMQLIDA